MIRVWRAEGQAPPGPPSGRTSEATATGEGTLHENPPLVHEQQAQVSPTAREGSKKLGEEMGPFPTIDVGNTGPLEQSASHAYATDSSQEGGVVLFAVRPGRINLGPLTRPLYIPSTAVRSISMERVVLALEGDQIPDEWRKEHHFP